MIGTQTQPLTSVIAAKAGIHSGAPYLPVEQEELDARLRGNDGKTCRTVTI